MSRMSVAQSRLAARLAESIGEEVTYTRGPDRLGGGLATTVSDAIRGRNTHQRLAIADGRANLEEEPQDWLLGPDFGADWGLGRIEPARGDRITDADGRVYEVQPRDQEPEQRRSDAYGHLLRVRTVRVA